ncbi:MAG: hypothetical protein MK089_03555 [Phycisphaerales bacterium]|nr:hypothetical protein [Phycisphaerales bacterium]
MLNSRFVRCAAVATCVSGIMTMESAAVAGDGIGTFVWFDSAVWSATDWFGDGSPPSCKAVIAGNDYLKPLSTIVADANGTGFTNLHDLVTDQLTMPAGAKLNNGNVFVISTSLDPTGYEEFRPWDELSMNPNNHFLKVPACYGTVDEAKEMTYRAFHDFVKKMMAPATGDPVPVSLMFSSFRSLRFGRILSEEQHLDPHDASGTIYFGGMTEMGAPSVAPNLAPADSSQESALGRGIWSIHWPENATQTEIDDVDMTLNYVDRCIDFVGYCNQQNDLGSSPVLDIYLDLELFQLSHIAPSNDNSTPFGTEYPGIGEMPKRCLQNMSWWDKDAGKAAIDSYWAVPANVADAFWRTLRMCRSKIDQYNSQRSPGDVELTLSVWAQEAYRFCSPRFGILDTMADPQAWDSDQTSSSYGRFNQPFGTAKVKRRISSDGQPLAYDTESWTCDCARLDPSAGVANSLYQMSPPVIDDFNINNCIFQFVDRIAYGTYQSVPAGLVQPKGQWKKKKFRNNTAVDLTGSQIPSVMDAHKILPGYGVPVGGPQSTKKINFASLGTYAPTAHEASNGGLLPDGGWLLYPPDLSGNGAEWNPLYYNPIGAWPPFAAVGDATPDWTGFSGQEDCAEYWGAYDMPWQGWAPFAARMLTAVDQWGTYNPGAQTPKVIMTLEVTPLDAGQAGTGTQGACFKNSMGNRWVWGEDVPGDTTPCAQGNTTAGSNQWPNVLIDPMCETDRVTYLFGGPSDTWTTEGSLRVGDAWGFAATDRLFNSQTGPSGAILSTHLDPLTPYALNNHFSYHCLMNHQGLDGFYVTIPNPNHPIPYAVDPVTGARSCWNPYGDGTTFGSCACPSATQHASNVSTVLYNMGTPGDVSGDNQADIDDLLAVIDRWGEACPWPCAFDHDDDGQIDVGDLLNVVEHWGTSWD